MDAFKMTLAMRFVAKSGVTTGDLSALVGRKPTIVRTRSKKFEAPSAVRTDNFIKITYPHSSGSQRVEYYIPPSHWTPFHNLYRIVADPVSDYVTHRAA